MTQPRFRVLALDLDGTLLDPDGEISLPTVESLGRAVDVGIRVVLCTGRRPRRAFPIARSLRIDTPIVCNSGALIKTLADQTIWRADWDRSLFEQVKAALAAEDQPVISFTDRAATDADYLVRVKRTGRPLFDDFLEHNDQYAEVDPNWPDRLDRVHFHLCAIGSRPAMLRLQKVLLEQLGSQIQTFVQKSPRYAGTMCEVLRADAHKWTAIKHLCQLWDVDTAEVCAVGDDMNDIPMIQGAGLGVAMAHAPAAVLAVADRVTASNTENGVARLIDELLVG